MLKYLKELCLLDGTSGREEKIREYIISKYTDNKETKLIEHVIRVYPIDTPKQAKIPFHICRKTIVKHFKIFHNPIDITNDYNVK